MRTNRFLYALGIGCTLCACSSHDEPIGGQEEPDYSKSNKYVTVAIVTSNDGTRAEGDSPFDDGVASEYAVTGVGFYFFDRLGNCVDTEYVTEAEFKEDGVTNENPAVTVMGTVEVQLVANRVYDNVIAVLNPNEDLFVGDTKKDLKTISKENILKYFASYAGSQTDGYTMSNSVFVDKAEYNGDGNGTPQVAVAITTHNIYTKENETDKLTPEEIEDKAINIYVERVCAKVQVDAAPTFETYFVDAQGKEQNISVMVMGGTEKTIKVEPVFKGMGLSVTSQNANLLKNIDGLKYKFNDEITKFEWNDASNKRSYWENTLGDKTTALGGGYNYTKWKDITTTASLTRYINPNTIDATSYDSDNADKTTKFLVTAQLTYTTQENGKDVSKPLDLVKFSGGFWMADYLIFHAAKRASENLSAMVYPEDFTGDVEAAQNAVKAITETMIQERIELTAVAAKDDMKEAYLAKLSIKDKADFLVGVTDANLKAALAPLVNAEIKKTLDEITSRQIQYWKNGLTYFYVPIRHEGFQGLAGGKNGKYLNGVVRNHVYKISIENIWGLGTPVIDPDKPIDPERPDDAPDSYMTAKIHVLKWRVVSSDVTMH